jgi:predicted nucleotide-binding protein
MKTKKILIIDDEPKEYEYLKCWLKSIEYCVLPEEFSEMSKAVDPNCEGEGIGDYVMRQIKEHYEDIGLILCDVVFGDADAGGDNLWGGDIIRSIRNNNEIETSNWTSMVPIIAVSQFADKHRVEVARDGADFVSSKPKSEIEKKILKYVIETQVNKFEKYLNMKKKDKKKVFIVHGHDGEAKVSVQLFLKQLGLEAIVLHKQANGGDTIIEKIEHHTDVGYAVVLYTDCDLGRGKEETDLKPRARQNVVFEHGYLMSKLGRNKVCALVGKDKDGKIVECPGDISGVVNIPLDAAGAWKMLLAKELKKQGIDVDLDGGIEDL